MIDLLTEGPTPLQEYLQADAVLILKVEYPRYGRTNFPEKTFNDKLNTAEIPKMVKVMEVEKTTTLANCKML